MQVYSAQRAVVVVPIVDRKYGLARNTTPYIHVDNLTWNEWVSHGAVTHCFSLGRCRRKTHERKRGGGGEPFNPEEHRRVSLSRGFTDIQISINWKNFAQSSAREGFRDFNVIIYSFRFIFLDVYFWYFLFWGCIAKSSFVIICLLKFTCFPEYHVMYFTCSLSKRYIKGSHSFTVTKEIMQN